MDEPKAIENETNELLRTLIEEIRQLPERMRAANSPPPRRLVVTIDEACEMLGCKRSHTFQLIAQGVLDTHREGKRTMVTIESIEARLREPKWQPTRKKKTPYDAVQEAAKIRALVSKKPRVGPRDGTG